MSVDDRHKIFESKEKTQINNMISDITFEQHSVLERKKEKNNGKPVPKNASSLVT